MNRVVVRNQGPYLDPGQEASWGFTQNQQKRNTFLACFYKPKKIFRDRLSTDEGTEMCGKSDCLKTKSTSMRASEVCSWFPAPERDRCLQNSFLGIT